MDAASNSAGGTSARNDRNIQMAIGRFIAVWMITTNQMLSSSPMAAAIR